MVSIFFLRKLKFLKQSQCFFSVYLRSLLFFNLRLAMFMMSTFFAPFSHISVQNVIFKFSTRRAQVFAYLINWKSFDVM